MSNATAYALNYNIDDQLPDEAYQAMFDTYESAEYGRRCLYEDHTAHQLEQLGIW